MLGNLIGYNNGPGIAAGVVLLTLMDTLVKNKIIDRGEIARILAVADTEIAGWGEGNTAVRDARRVLKTMRGLGA